MDDRIFPQRSAGSSGPQKPKLLDRVRLAIRTHHYSARTEEAYVAWIKRFIFFHNKRYPAERLRRTVVRASKLARPPAADPQRR